MILKSLTFDGACFFGTEEMSCSAECMVTDSVTSGYQAGNLSSSGDYPVHCVTAWHAAFVGLFFQPYWSHFTVCTCNSRVSCSTVSLIWAPAQIKIILLGQCRKDCTFTQRCIFGNWSTSLIPYSLFLAESRIQVMILHNSFHSPSDNQINKGFVCYCITKLTVGEKLDKLE